MVAFDAVSPGARPRTDPHLRVGERRVTDLTAGAGALVWGAAAVAWAPVPLGTVDLFVCLAVLVVVPVGLGLAATPRRSGATLPPYTLAVLAQFPAAVLVVAALALPVGSPASVALATPWLGVTLAAAAVGAWRLLSRGVGPLPELAVDAALLYVPVGAVALLLHRAGIGLRFRPIIVLLTVVHFHYAGFALPLVTGLAGRTLADADGEYGDGVAGRAASIATVVVVVNIGLIAVGITFSPLVEVVAVALFTVAVAALAVLWLLRVVPAVDGAPAALLAVASLSVVATMALALAYGYSAFPATGALVTLGEMVRWHGTLNVAGFALPALLAFRIHEG